MILNNYLAMRHVHSLDKQQLALQDINELHRLCLFASEEVKSDGFLHPLIRAIVLHFWRAYDHPL